MQYQSKQAQDTSICARKILNTYLGKGKRSPTVDLSQPGQYACEERVTIKGPKGTFENVALLGPFRNETQVEISMTDSRKLGIPGIIRQSGDTKGTPGCTLLGPAGEIELDHGVIVAKRIST